MTAPAPAFPIFLSVVLVLRNQSAAIEPMLRKAERIIEPAVSDYELIIVDNGSSDDSIALLKRLTSEAGLANLQVYALTQEVDSDTAAWAGLENALGDFTAVVDPRVDDIAFLPEMLRHAIDGSDVVFARNTIGGRENFLYRNAFRLFHRLYQWFTGIHLASEAPQYRVLSKRVVNYLLQHAQPALSYRHLPASAGFARANLAYRAKPDIDSAGKPPLGPRIDRGIRLLVSTTRAPMRLVTSLTFAGAISNIVYSFYVVVIAMTKADVAPGWVSLSLQQSGMFFLISLVLFVLGEYILHMASLSTEGPLYHVGQEFNSVRLTRNGKLNVEVVVPPAGPRSGPT